MPNDPPQPVREWEADRACSWAAFAPTSLSNQRSAVLRRVQSDPARNPARIQPGA